MGLRTLRAAPDGKLLSGNDCLGRQVLRRRLRCEARMVPEAVDDEIKRVLAETEREKVKKALLALASERRAA